MPVHNAEVADILGKLADLLEINGANVFRVRSYRQAARTVGGLPRNITEMIDRDEDLSDLPGVGQSMAQKIEEIVETGKLGQLEKIEKSVPGELSELLSLPGLGPKRVKELHDELGIEGRDDLAKAAEAGRVRDLEGLGEKTEQKIRDELARRRDAPSRRRLTEVEEIGESLLDHLRDVDGVKQAVIAGSYRRRKRRSATWTSS